MKEIKNTTIYSKEIIKKFLEIYYFERIKKIRIILNIFIGYIIISFFFIENKTTINMFTFIFALFGIIELNTNMIPRLNYYKTTKSKENIIDKKVTYIFKKYNFKLNKDEYIDYKTLKKVIETDTAYYLFLNNRRSLLVDKTPLTNEEKELLTKRFKEQVASYKYQK